MKSVNIKPVVCPDILHCCTGKILESGKIRIRVNQRCLSEPEGNKKYCARSLYTVSLLGKATTQLYETLTSDEALLT